MRTTNTQSHDEVEEWARTLSAGADEVMRTVVKFAIVVVLAALTLRLGTAQPVDSFALQVNALTPEGVVIPTMDFDPHNAGLQGALCRGQVQIGDNCPSLAAATFAIAGPLLEAA